MAELRLKSTGTIKLFENDNTSNITIASPASLGGDRTITLPDASVTLASGTMLATDGSGASLTSLNATQLGSGTVPDARFPATLPAASGVNLTSLDAANLGSNTVPTARLGSGTASSSTILYGDQTYKTEPTGAKLVFLGKTSTTSNVSELDVADVIDSTYSIYYIVWNKARANGATFDIAINGLHNSSTEVSSYGYTAYGYRHDATILEWTQLSGADIMVADTSYAAAGAYCNGNMWLYNPADTTDGVAWFTFQSSWMMDASGAKPASVTGGGLFRDTDAVTGIRLSELNGEDMYNGNLVVYGLLDS